MKPVKISILVLLILSACSRNPRPGKDIEKDMVKLREQVISIAESYAMEQLQNKNITSDANGIIIIGNDQKRIIIDPSGIKTGFIDANMSVDAIIPVCPFEGQYETTTHQLIVTEKDGKYILAGALETDMKVISINNGIITADVPEHSRNNPLFNCSSCWEVVKYRLVNGELVKADL